MTSRESLFTPENVTMAKTAFDTFRSAIGLIKDARTLLPVGQDTEAIDLALSESERQLRVAEAATAKALGYELCKCEYPPTPMLLVGHKRDGSKVFECPLCHSNTASPISFTRTRSLTVAAEVEQPAPEKKAPGMQYKWSAFGEEPS